MIGDAIGRPIEARLTRAALRVALATRRPVAGCIHHSDRGLHCAAKVYRDVLDARQPRNSMHRRGNPYDTAKTESFMKTLKVETVYLMDLGAFEVAAADPPRSIREVSNHKPQHSALGFA